VTLATALTRAQFGLDAPLVQVEVHCGAGLPQFSIVGLAETAVRETVSACAQPSRRADSSFRPAG
jgi:magnesium chelatase family protein